MIKNAIPQSCPKVNLVFGQLWGIVFVINLEYYTKIRYVYTIFLLKRKYIGYNNDIADISYQNTCSAGKTQFTIDENANIIYCNVLDHDEFL